MTLIARPNTLFPAYNQARVIVDSTNKNNEAFEYLFEVYDFGGLTPIATYPVRPRFGDGYGELDISRLLSSKVSSEIEEINTVEFFTASNSFYRYDLKIGERYIENVNYTSSLTNSGGYVRINVTNSYTAGDQLYIVQDDNGVANPQLEGYHTVMSSGVGYFVVNVLWTTITDATINGTVKFADNRRTVNSAVLTYSDNTAFNGSLKPLEIVSFSPAQYDLSTNSDRFLTSLINFGDFTISPSAPMVVNLFTESDSGSMRFENDNGDLFEVAVSAGHVTAVQIGTYNTPTLSLISGTAPLIKSNTEWYEVYWYDGGQKSRAYRIYIDRQCEVEPWQLCYVDRFGSLLPLAFTLRSTENMNITREMFSERLTGEVNGTVWQPVIHEFGKKQINQSKSITITLESPFVSEEMSAYYYDMFASPAVILFDGSDFIPVTLNDNSVRKETRNKGKLIRYTCNVTLSNIEAING